MLDDDDRITDPNTDDPMSDLDDEDPISDLGEEGGGAEVPAWGPLTADDAAYAVDAILIARERLARIEANCAAMIARAKRRVERAEAIYLPQLKAYYQAHPPVKGKTIRLPTGSLKSYTVRGGPRVVDADAALQWARAQLPAAVRIAESLDKPAIKAYVEQTGDLPPGVERTPDDERFGVS